MNKNNFARYAWGVLAYTLLVILWGAYVRATGSGAGCGQHWPLCNGVVVPRAPAVETMIEFTHRLSSGLAGLLVVGLLVWAWRRYGPGHAVRRVAALSLVFIIIEGLLGAGLVLFELVADNASVARAASMALHLSNTFVLLAMLSLTAWWGSTLDVDDKSWPLQWRGQGMLSRLLGLGLLLLLVLSAAGAVTALGDTLFPPGTLAEGVSRDFAPAAHFLERLRIWHPLLAVFSSIFLFVLANHLRTARPRAARFARLLQVVLAVQLAAGLLNVILLVPVWMQLVHLFLADVAWLSLVLLSAQALAQSETAPAGQRDAAPAVEMAA